MNGNRAPLEGASLDPRQVDDLIALGTVRTYPKRTVVFQEGDESDQLYVVLSGRVKVYLADQDGREIVLDTVGPGQYFGEMALDGRPRSASVITAEPSRLAVVPRANFERFLQAHPEAALGLAVTVIRRARNLTRVAGSLALLDVYGRVARLLLDGAVQEGDRLVLRERLTQKEIAARVGASREMVSRILTDLREGGFVSVDGDRIVIERTLPENW
jgi:CRP/FNR family cyclic AMP-dependent transcriptional regulator